MKKYRVGIIGAGFIGGAHVEALRRLGNIEVVSLCKTHNVNAKAKELFIENAYTDYKKMIDEMDLDFVHICTPNNTHYPMAKYALEHDVNVVLEKPLTMTVSEGEELIRIAEQRKLINAVNYHNRMYPAIAYAKRYIKEGNLGQVFSINGVYIQDWLLYEDDYSWRLNEDESGKTRAVADIGTHWMDLVEYISGLKITEVFAEFKTVYDERKKPDGEVAAFSTKKASKYESIKINTEDMAAILFRFENGALGNLTVSQMTAGKKNNIEVLISGTKQSLEWKLENLSDIKIGHRDKPNEIITKDYTLMSEVKSYIDFPAGHEEGFPDAFKQNFKKIYNDTFDLSYARFSDGLRQVLLTEKIYESAKTHKWVKV